MAGETLAWRTIKPGHRVLARDGEDIGTVAHVLADEGADIFHGVSVKRGALGPELEITADRIDHIGEDAVHTSVAEPELQR
ncbi:MAG: PRC-barrel domain-containing protein [Candidatus Dormibacteria bacterium]